MMRVSLLAESRRHFLALGPRPHSRLIAYISNEKSNTVSVLDTDKMELTKRSRWVSARAASYEQGRQVRHRRRRR